MPTYGFDGTVDQVAMAKLARYAGADYGVETSADWRVTPVAGQDRTVAVASGTGYGHFVLDEGVAGLTLQLDAIASGKRWDLVCRRRTWNPAGGGSSVFTKVAGVAATDPLPAIPATRLRGPGVQDDQLLALVQVVAGQSSVGQVIDLRTWPTMVYNTSSLLALTDVKLGAEALIGGIRYHLELDSAGNPTWVSPKTSTQTVITGVTAAQAGWIVDTGFVNRCIVDPTGKDVVYEVELRRTGAAIGFGGSGAISDFQVAQLSGPLPDANLGDWAVPVDFRAIGGSSATQESGVYCNGYLTPAGGLWVESGIPSGFIAKRVNVGDWSLQARIAFRKA